MQHQVPPIVDRAARQAHDLHLLVAHDLRALASRAALAAQMTTLRFVKDLDPELLLELRHVEEQSRDLSNGLARLGQQARGLAGGDPECLRLLQEVSVLLAGQHDRLECATRGFERTLRGRIDSRCDGYLDILARSCRGMGEQLDVLAAAGELPDIEQTGPPDVAQAAARALERIRLLLDHAGARIELARLPAGGAPSPGLAWALGRVLDHALATRVAGRPPVVRIGGDERQLVIEDEGTGHPPGEAPLALDLFYWVGRDRPRERFGLALARLAVERLGGSIEAAPGEPAGTRIELRLAH